MKDRLRRIAFPGAVAAGAVVYVGLRVPLLVEAYDYGAVGEFSATWWWLVEAIPTVSLTFIAAAAPAALLAREGRRGWWLPTVAFLFLGTIVERWLGYDSVAVRAAGPFFAMGLDLVVVLGPAVVLRRLSAAGTVGVDRYRILAGALAASAFLLLQFPLAVEGDDPGGAAAMLLLLAVLWPISDRRRTTAYVLIGVAASKLAALAVFAGPLAAETGVRASVDVAMMICFGLLVTPTAAAFRRLARRPAPAAGVA
jgi:hypothetical protein